MNTKVNEKGQTIEEFLAAYKQESWPRPSFTADIVVFSVFGDQPIILLIERKNHPFIGCYALPGGFVNQTESAEDAAKRELEEETGLTNIELEPLLTVSTPNRDPRGWCVTSCFLGVTADKDAAIAGDDAKNLDWFTVDYIVKGNEYFLKLNSLDKEINAHLIVKRTESGKIDMNKTEIISSDLAFDHAKIILAALENL